MEARLWYRGYEGELDLRDPELLDMVLTRAQAHLEEKDDTTMIVTKYAKVRELGCGSFARVFLYEGEHNARQYAVKVSHKSSFREVWMPHKPFPEHPYTKTMHLSDISGALSPGMDRRFVFIYRGLA
eukprot:8543790-Pyramimonas_sp.AAC.1